MQNVVDIISIVLRDYFIHKRIGKSRKCEIFVIIMIDIK